MSVDATTLQSFWDLVPLRKTCSYGKRTAINVYAFSPVRETFYRNLAVSEGAPSVGKYTKAKKYWFAPKSENTALAPAVGDVWVDGAETWRVLTVEETGGQGTWKLGTVKLDLPAATKDTISIFRPDVGSDSRGMRQTTAGTTVASGLTAAVVVFDAAGGFPVTAGLYNEEFQRPGVYRIFLYDFFNAQAQDIVTDQNGTKYSVANVVSPSSLEDLAGMDCMLLT